MTIETDVKLDFQAVLLRPKRSTISSRNNVNLIREIYFKNSDRKWNGIPLIVSNMDTIGTFEMYKVLSKEKIITCFHKYYDVNEYQTYIGNKPALDYNYYIISPGMGENDCEKC